MDFLLIWNIRHWANPNKTAQLPVVNRRLGLRAPQIVTPEMLWLEERQMSPHAPSSTPVDPVIDEVRAARAVVPRVRRESGGTDRRDSTAGTGTPGKAA
jgi:hypothetical protein